MVAEALPRCEVSVDPNRLRQVFANLLDNALKIHRGRGGSPYHFPRKWELRSPGLPTPMGISEEEQPKIWSRMYPR